MTTLIVGCGYLGRRVGRLLADRGDRVLGTVRSAVSAADLPAWGVEPVIADVLDPASAAALPAADRVLFSVGYDCKAGVPIREVYVEGLRRILDGLAARVGRWVYISSTGVFGQADGSVVDEDSPAAPVSESGRACLEAESVLFDAAAAHGLSATVLRPSGLYGPGRVIGREALLAGRPVASDPDRWLNLVHIDDAAAAAVAALERDTPPRPIYLVSDDRPIPRREYYGLAADLLGAEAPRFGPNTAGDTSNKRVGNRRMREELGVVLRHPDIRVGLPAAVAG